MTTPIPIPIDWEVFRDDILSGDLDGCEILEVDQMAGTEERISGRVLRQRFEEHASDLAVSSMLGKVGLLH
jgi:hypothetical protein